jgi:hypothetical protein
VVGPLEAGRIQAVVATLLVNDYDPEPNDYCHCAINEESIVARRARVGSACDKKLTVDDTSDHRTRHRSMPLELILSNGTFPSVSQATGRPDDAGTPHETTIPLQQ